MDSARWERIQTLFSDAAGRPASEQRGLLESLCADDPTLIAEVTRLLDEDAQNASLLDRQVAHVAYQMVGKSHPLSVDVKEFRPYRLKELLGEGGMGVVYLAERDDLGNLVAIKILRDAWLSPARRERFASEQRTLAQLNHPGIARLYDAQTLPDGTPWFVMEYVDGIPLTDYCTKHGSTIRERLQLFRAVCEAVQYAHQQGIIHRDLKPSNILVKWDGSVRLLDFGIAKQMESLDARVDQTRTGLRLMTPAYAAPEQIRGDRVGVQSDVYSLGVILYELLAGRSPFDLSNRTPAEAVSIIVKEDPEKPWTARLRSAAADVRPRASSMSKAAWADMDVLCLTAMHKDLRRRYQSVEALIRDVDHFLRDEPLEARPDTLSYTLGKFVRRNWRGVSTAAAVFLLIVGMAIFYTVRLTAARNAAVAEAARTQRIQQFMQNIFQGGDQSAGPADNLRVVTLLDRGVQEARALDHDPAVQAALFETLGSIYQKLGKLDQAGALLQASLEKTRALYGGDSAEVGNKLVALGLLRDDQARYDEAEKLVRDGLEMDTRHLSPSHPSLAKAMTALGKVLEDRGAYDKSIATLEQAVQLDSLPNAPTADLADALHELANAHYYAGHYESSEMLNQRVLGMYKQIYGERHPRVADILINLGAINFDRGHYPEAEQFDREALDIVQAWYGKDNPQTAIDLTILARALVFESRFDEAVNLLQQSLAIKEAVYGKVHPSVASTLNELGNAASKQGKYDAAEQYFQRMADIYRAVYGEHHYLLGIALSNLASVYVNRHEWARAERIFRQVVSLFSEAQSPTHLNTGIARIKLGRTLLRQRRFAEAETETRAGYDILVQDGMNPTVSWLASARKDLVEEYDALKQTENAARFRAEQAKLDENAARAAAKK